MLRLRSGTVGSMRVGLDVGLGERKGSVMSFSCLLNLEKQGCNTEWKLALQLTFAQNQQAVPSNKRRDGRELRKCMRQGC